MCVLGAEGCGFVLIWHPRANVATWGHASSCESIRASSEHQLSYLALSTCIHTATWHFVSSAEGSPQHDIFPELLQGPEEGRWQRRFEY